jgi:hypothetical protein
LILYSLLGGRRLWSTISLMEFYLPLRSIIKIVLLGSWNPRQKRSSSKINFASVGGDCHNLIVQVLVAFFKATT